MREGGRLPRSTKEAAVRPAFQGSRSLRSLHPPTVCFQPCWAEEHRACRSADGVGIALKPGRSHLLTRRVISRRLIVRYPTNVQNLGRISRIHMHSQYCACSSRSIHPHISIIVN